MNTIMTENLRRPLLRMPYSDEYTEGAIVRISLTPIFMCEATHQNASCVPE